MSVGGSGTLAVSAAAGTTSAAAPQVGVSNAVVPLAAIIQLETTCMHPHVRLLFGVGSPWRIAENVRVTPQLFCNAFCRYTSVAASNGKPIHIVAQSKVTDQQVLYVQSVLVTLLTDVEGGISKAAIGDAAADLGLVISIYDSEKSTNKGPGRKYGEADLDDQSLFAGEIVTPQSSKHQRGCKDASWEEVLHNLQNAGLRLARPEFQEELDEALRLALLESQYVPDDDYSSWTLVSQEFFAVAMEAYFGMSETRKDGLSGGEYIYITRAAMEAGDPITFGLIRRFFTADSGLPIHPSVQRSPRQQGLPREAQKRLAKRESARRWWAAVALLRCERKASESLDATMLLAQVGALLCHPDFRPERAGRCRALCLYAAATRGVLRMLADEVPSFSTVSTAVLQRVRREAGLRQRRLPREHEVAAAARHFILAVNQARSQMLKHEPIGGDGIDACRRIFELFAEGGSGGPGLLASEDLVDLLLAAGFDGFDEANRWAAGIRGSQPQGEAIDFPAFLERLRRKASEVSEDEGSSSGSESSGSGSDSSGSSHGS